MATEIERKFLVDRLPDLSEATATQIRQGYVTHPDDSCEVRLRQRGDRYLATIKSGSGLVRGEYEAEIGREAFEILWAGIMGHISKVRHTGPLPGGLMYELDIYQGPQAPLVTVEVEFTSVSEARAFRPPAWFGREVTGQRAYSNRVMAIGETNAA
ncbi:CYTH domain-containing protein [Pseudooceanicola nanhaiensis]|uniref:CYTH domain-containing protein n=1 Tax=Pseudooceanicola nanhaiensis TaxID=375761 RepID=UPI001CD7D020|nr:CYTH domain-containing protein [Pseudooceanicola nanhaiensis]MCA0919081.1 CYTH domain-containing protein [Pseudooceanicola nanhaiensis]